MKKVSQPFGSLTGSAHTISLLSPARGTNTYDAAARHL